MVNIAAALAVALPLYTWPLAGVWDPVFDTIKSNPNTTFNIIVNPNSGPGSYPPNSDYITGVATLNSYSNVNTYGYVHTSYAKRPIAQIKADVAKYSSWSKYKAADIALDGIFVDEAPVDTAQLPYMENVATYIRKTMPSNGTHVWTNPGCAVDKSFYQYADTVTAFEDDYSVWTATGSKTLAALPATLRSKTSVMVLNYPGRAKGIATQAKAMIQAGYRSGFLYGLESYQEFSTTWGDFADLVDADQ